MTPVLSHLRAMGYEVRAEGEEIALTWQGAGHPDPDQARPLLAELARRKGEALTILQAEADRPPLSPSDPLPPYPFAVRSRVLDGAEVWIVPDGWTEPVPGPTYSHTEVRALDRNRPTPEALRAIHQVKVSLDGEVVR